VLAEIEGVLNDSVMDDGNEASGVDVGMSVVLRRGTVGGPACVSDRGSEGPRREGRDGGLELRDGSSSAQAMEGVIAIDEGEPGRVVASVLEAAESFKKEGRMGGGAEGGNDSAHGLIGVAPVGCAIGWLVAPTSATLIFTFANLIPIKGFSAQWA
jgi:hypothetical protein